MKRLLAQTEIKPTSKYVASSKEVHINEKRLSNAYSRNHLCMRVLEKELKNHNVSKITLAKVIGIVNMSNKKIKRTLDDISKSTPVSDTSIIGSGGMAMHLNNLNVGKTLNSIQVILDDLSQPFCDITNALSQLLVLSDDLYYIFYNKHDKQLTNKVDNLEHRIFNYLYYDKSSLSAIRDQFQNVIDTFKLQNHTRTMRKIDYISPKHKKKLSNRYVWGNVYQYPITDQHNNFSGVYGTVYQYGQDFK